MKTIRISVTLVGLSLALFALSSVGARGQGVHTTHFAGTFTLPFEAQWGKMTLPAGDYTLQYDTLDNGAGLVVVQGTDKGSPQGMVLAGPRDHASAPNNAIVCIREGNALVVRSLEMPAISESVRFNLPRGAKLVAHNGNRGGYTQLAEAPMLIQRIPVTLNTK
ncbi:MAG TPA: hypothetical protein VFQ24_12600 [Terriglobia bacterium]|nr:hypothetical protein [Terriglobia bacterium]